ncbi:hypothetical protein NQ315_007156, partial [Exocentrus adspersus]
SVKSLLIEKNADPNIVLPKKGISPFHLVIGSDSDDFALKVTRLILQYGGNPNVRSDDGLTPVHIAAAWGKIEILNLLLTSGGDPEARDSNYMTPVLYARREEFVDCLDLLKSYLPVKNDVLNREKEDCENYDLVLDKILINNGHTVGEYQIVNEYQPDSITKEKRFEHLNDLPQSNSTEYVMNWFNKHVTPDVNVQAFPKFLKGAAGSGSSEDGFPSCESSGDESDNEHSRLNAENVTFRKAYTKTRKVSKNDKKVGFGKTDSTDLFDTCLNETAIDLSKIEQFSNESGIVTLPNSLNDQSNTVDDKTPGSTKKITLLKPDTSSDYMTCSSNSLLEKNIFEVTEDVSINLFTSDESKSIKCVDVDNGKAEDACNNDSLVSVSEVYKYVDKDEGIVLYERRILKTLSEYNGSTKSSSFSSKLSTLPDIIDYDTDTLRKELTTHGYNPGPITATTKRVYLKKLHQLQKCPVSSRPAPKKVYSVELEKTIRDATWCGDLAYYRSLEEAVSKQFSNPDPARKWREGVNKSSFTYLLLDPRITNNLPGRAETLKPKEMWELFLSAVFYVGKGKRSRPYSHLYEAVSLWKKGEGAAPNKKIQNIMDIWKSNCGVICLHVYQNIIPVEAYTREAAMISALKLENLTNARSGDFYGIAATWPQKQRKMFGVYLLYKAMLIFLNEGERQLCPSDID